MWGRRGETGVGERFFFWYASLEHFKFQNMTFSHLNNKVKLREESVKFLNLEQTETKEANGY